MKSITTLVKDIQDRLVSSTPFDEKTVEAFSLNLAQKLANRLARESERPTLRLSNLGTPCDRKLWYSIRRPELAEPLTAATRLKFLFGDILEEVLLFLARAAGHSVEREQEEVDVNGVKGHIDGVVDGELVDVKSASSYGFRKFAEHGLADDDSFGYIDQLGAYSYALGSERAHFLAVDKTLGHIALDTHDRSGKDYDKLVEEKRNLLARNDPPPRGYSDEPEGASGNRKLGIACSYCSFKSTCWPNLRAFDYSRKPVFLTKVVKEPKVREIV